MEHDTIRDLVARLDAAVPKADARVQMQIYGGGPDEGVLVANRGGYLRLGIELMKGADAAPPEDTSNANGVEVDLEYLMTPDSTIGFTWFERRDPDIEPVPLSNGDRWLAVAFFVVLAAICIFAVVGLVATVRWLIA